MAHLKLTVFQILHVAWCGQQTSTYQIHGFSSSKYDDIFPQLTDIVISSAEGKVTKEVFILNRLFKKLGNKNNIPVHSYVANDLPKLSYANIVVNKKSLLIDNSNGIVVDSDILNGLVAKDNRQGKYSVIYTHAPFVHIELGSNLRSMGAVFSRIAQVVVLAIEQTICATAYKRVTHSHKHFFHVVSKMCKCWSRTN